MIKILKCAIAMFLVQVGFLLPGFAKGSISLLLEEPYGFFGGLSPTGHSAIYLSRVCATSPLVLRPCEEGESGVVISRYDGIGDYDWVAIPLVPYLYAVVSLDSVPARVDAREVEVLRQQYRREYLTEIASEATGRAGDMSGWRQLIGAAYIRKIYSYRIDTPAEEDEALIHEFNSKENKSHFNLFFNNCADFSRTVLNLYYPGATRRSITADLGLTTPKQIAKSLTKYSHDHEALDMSVYIIPQVAGSIPRSHPPHGITESLIKTKKYVIPIALLQPYVAIGIAVTYLTRGRFDPSHHAQKLLVADQIRGLRDDMQPAAASAANPPPWSSTVASALVSDAVLHTSPE